MNEQPIKEELLNILRLISSKEDLTQRDLSNHMGISLGKTNYLLKELIKRGLVSVKNFSTKESKLFKVKYILTKSGLKHKLHLTYHFLKRKEKEFDAIKKEWDALSYEHRESLPENTK